MRPKLLYFKIVFFLVFCLSFKSSQAQVWHKEGSILIDSVLLLASVENPNEYYYVPKYFQVRKVEPGKVGLQLVRYITEGRTQKGGIAHAMIDLHLEKEALDQIRTKLKQVSTSAQLKGIVPLSLEKNRKTDWLDSSVSGIEGIKFLSDSRVLVTKEMSPASALAVSNKLDKGEAHLRAFKVSYTAVQKWTLSQAIDSLLLQLFPFATQPGLPFYIDSLKASRKRFNTVMASTSDQALGQFLEEAIQSTSNPNQAFYKKIPDSLFTACIAKLRSALDFQVLQKERFFFEVDLPIEIPLYLPAVKNKVLEPEEIYNLKVVTNARPFSKREVLFGLGSDVMSMGESGLIDKIELEIIKKQQNHLGQDFIQKTVWDFSQNLPLNNTYSFNYSLPDRSIDNQLIYRVNFLYKEEFNYQNTKNLWRQGGRWNAHMIVPSTRLRSITYESDGQLLQEQGVRFATIDFYSDTDDKLFLKRILLLPNAALGKQKILVGENNQGFRYATKWYLSKGEIFKSTEESRLNDGYIYLSFDPEKLR